jgi:hypothetical protein
MIKDNDILILEPASSQLKVISGSSDIVKVGNLDNINFNNAIFKVNKVGKKNFHFTFSLYHKPDYYLFVDKDIARIKYQEKPNFDENVVFRAYSALQGQSVELALESTAFPGFFLSYKKSKFTLEKRRKKKSFFKNANWKVIYIKKNFSGEERYVKRHNDEVKLYINKTALIANNPEIGFIDNNTFGNSCHPDAAVNLFRWYGIDDLASRDRITLDSHFLGHEMNTENWKILWVIPGEGTWLPTTVKIIKKWMTKYMPDNYKFHYLHSQGVDGYYHLFKGLLRRGNPIMVEYKIGYKNGHAAVLIGIEDKKNSNNFNNSKLIFANGEDFLWKDFKKKWKRDFLWLDRNILSMAGQHPYVSVFISTELPSIKSGSSAGQQKTGPRKMK